MTHQRRILSIAFVLSSTLMLGCSSDAQPTATGAAGAGGSTLDPQLPPSSASELSTWLTAFQSMGWESDWSCEASATAKTAGAAAIHVHGPTNRVCNNQVLAKATRSGAAQLPVGSAAIKFVGNDPYVEVKTKADSAAGDNWFWRSGDGSVATLGATVCVGCHAGAGSDADHPGLGDFVYFQVPPKG